MLCRCMGQTKAFTTKKELHFFLFPRLNSCKHSVFLLGLSPIFLPVYDYCASPFLFNVGKTRPLFVLFSNHEIYSTKFDYSKA